MANFIGYKGFKIEPCENGFALWGASLFEPLDIKFSVVQSFENCKKSARTLLRMAKLKTWPVLFADRIVKN